MYKDKPYGLVGKCFQDHNIWVDLDVENNHHYSLTEQQRVKIGKIKFCSAIPIFNGSQKKVKAVVAVDSEKKMVFDDEKKEAWKNHMVYFGAFIDKNIKL